MTQPAPPALPLVHLHAIPETAVGTVQREALSEFLANPAGIVRVDFDADIAVSDGKQFGTALVAFSDGTFERVLTTASKTDSPSVKARIRGLRNMLSGRTVPPYAD